MRAVVLGAGSIGELHRRSAIAAGAEVVAVMASTPERSRSVATRWGTAALEHLRDLAPLAPDVVHVCTPNAAHLEQVRAALAAGAHVICEKPLATSVAEAETMAEAAQAAGRVGTVPFVNRFHPAALDIRGRVAAGELGDVRLIHGTYLQDWMLPPEVTDWRVDASQGGPSRAFADIGSHWCDLVEFLTGERIASLVADTAVTVPQRPGPAGGPPARVTTEDVALLLFRTAGGARGTATISQVSAGRTNRLWVEVDGSEGSAALDEPESVWLGSPDASRTVSVRAQRAGGDPYERAFGAFVDASYRAMRGEQVPELPTFADGVGSARLVDAVLESARTRAWVDVLPGSAAPPQPDAPPRAAARDQSERPAEGGRS